jgi:hypothetical protein
MRLPGVVPKKLGQKACAVLHLQPQRAVRQVRLDLKEVFDLRHRRRVVGGRDGHDIAPHLSFQLPSGGVMLQYVKSHLRPLPLGRRLFYIALTGHTPILCQRATLLLRALARPRSLLERFLWEAPTA